MKSAFEYLRWANPIPFGNSSEQLFYNNHASLFNITTLQFNESFDIFFLIRADIVLRGLLNRSIMNKDMADYSKEQLEVPSVIEALHSQLPYVIYNGNKIYIPTYSEEINLLYEKEPSKLVDGEYKNFLDDDKAYVLDPFETYGVTLFDSTFTRLIRLKPNKDGIYAFYHVDFHTLFFIDEKGNLTEELPLLDEKVKVNSATDLFDHLEQFVEIYFKGDTEESLKALRDLNLLSSSLTTECLEQDAKYKRYLAKREAKQK